MNVKEISIRSYWIGWGDKESILLLKIQPDGSFSDEISNGEHICSAEDVEEFYKAVLEPPLSDYDFTDMGITQQWLEDHLNEAIETLYEPSEAMIQFYTKLFLDVQKVHEALHSYFTGTFRTDDYPDISIEIKCSKGPDIILKSISQLVFMIPWKIRNSNTIKAIETYNHRISRTLVKLLPGEFVNKMRLGDSLLLSTIEKRVLSPVRNEWGNLISIKNFGSALNPITDEYILKASNQGGLYKGEKGVVNYWMATIGHKDWPSNVFIYVEIADIDEKLGDINPFLNQVPNLVDSLLSVKWLSEYIKTHPNIEVKIQFCDEISMNDESMDLFWKDMFDFRPFVKLLFAGNSLPRVVDRSSGFLRRVLILPFNILKPK